MMKKLKALFFVALAVLFLAACSSSDDVGESGNSAESNLSVDKQDVQKINSDIASLVEGAKAIDASGYDDIVGTYMKRYSKYSFDNRHISYNLINALMLDSVFSTKSYGLALLMKGTFTADTVSKRWISSSSSALKFVYPDSLGNKCAIQITVIRDSSLFYNALQVQMERNDTIKATVVMKHLITTLTIGSTVVTVARNEYGSKPAVLTIHVDSKAIKNVFSLKYTSDSASFSRGRFLLSKKFDFEMSVFFFFIKGTCTDCARCSSCLAIAEQHRTNETVFKQYLAKTDSFITANLYSSNKWNNRLGKITLLPYQRKVNGSLQWYACLCLATDNGENLPLYSDVDITEFPKTLIKAFK